MEYKHPHKYNLKVDTLFHQEKIKYKVDHSCIYCSEFMGIEHDFEFCKTGTNFTRCSEELKKLGIVPIGIGVKYNHKFEQLKKDGE